MFQELGCRPHGQSGQAQGRIAGIWVQERREVGLSKAKQRGAIREPHGSYSTEDRKSGTRIGQSWGTPLEKGDFTTPSLCKAGDWALHRDPVSLKVWQSRGQSLSTCKQHMTYQP